MMTEDSMMSGTTASSINSISNSSVPHVRKSSSRTGAGSNNSTNTAVTTTNTATNTNTNTAVASGVATTMEMLSVAAGNSESNTTTSTATTQPPLLSSTTTTTAATMMHPVQHQQQQQYQQQQQSRSASHHHQQQQQQHHHLFHANSHTSLGGGGGGATGNHLYSIYRLYDVRSMDIQSALDQMKTLVGTRPQLIYKTAYYRKQTKNHWYRDDPAFIAIQIIALLFSCVAYSVAFKISIVHALSFMIISIVWNYIGMGIIMTSILRELTNRHLLSQHHHHTTTGSTTTTSHIQKQQVEWFYAYDIHCNAFFPLFMVLYVVQFFSMPITLGEGYIPLIIGNTLYAVAFSWYWYITHLGYRALPFLSHTEIFLFPITMILFVYLLMMIGYPFGFGYNMTRVMARFYFM